MGTRIHPTTPRPAFAVLRRLVLATSLLLLSATGCATRPAPRVPPFRFDRDTFAFPNETFWVYHDDPATGRMTHENREPRPDFAHRCFVVVRSAKQFQLHARFDPAAPVASDSEYRRIVRRIVRRSTRTASPEAERIRVPGYADLRAFSAGQERVVKDELGPAWQSYVQRGHWRMVMPFSRDHQERTADTLAAKAADHTPVAVHVVDFPGLTINHALLVFGVSSTPETMRFQAYDPNDSSVPVLLEYDRATHTFSLARTPYYRGGPLKVYEVYRSWWY